MTVDECRIIELPTISDPRGNLTFVEGHRHVPFAIERVYYLTDVPEGQQRGGHAHKDLHQVIIALHGNFSVLLDDGKNRRTVHLDRPHLGLHLPKMIWRELDGFSFGSVCMVLASAPYDEADYYREYDAFLKAIDDANTFS